MSPDKKEVDRKEVANSLKNDIEEISDDDNTNEEKMAERRGRYDNKKKEDHKQDERQRRGSWIGERKKYANKRRSKSAPTINRHRNQEKSK